MSHVSRLPGLAVATVGLTHFVTPDAYASITEAAFPDNIRRHTYVDGGIETLIGVGLTAARTRKAALVGLSAYAVYLGVSILRNR